MFINSRYSLLVKHLNKLVKKSAVSPVNMEAAHRVSRTEYEDYLLQKLFFKNGGIYLKVFSDPNELHRSINEAIAQGLILQDASGYVAVGPGGRQFSNLAYALLQTGYYVLLVAVMAGLGFAVGAAFSSVL
jgi:hypothetical protein